MFHKIDSYKYINVGQAKYIQVRADFPPHVRNPQCSVYAIFGDGNNNDILALATFSEPKDAFKYAEELVEELNDRARIQEECRPALESIAKD